MLIDESERRNPASPLMSMLRNVPQLLQMVLLSTVWNLAASNMLQMKLSKLKLMMALFRTRSSFPSLYILAVFVRY